MKLKMDSVDVELEEQLKEAGEQLLHPSDSIDELLVVLDQVEKLLSKVDQSPQKSMIEALKPSMKALIQDSLLKHSDDDVKVSVASCISEITRITAPDAPYDDDQMRDVFQLIVSSFEDLADRSSRSYNKRASILETVSKVRSCVIMLDLECDGLIVEMFEHFLRSVRDYHFESIYPSMETTMVLVLEESEEITAEMLRPLLASVKKDPEGVLPVARKLGEGVLLKSADKLKPCLMQILTSLGESLDMYTKVVASVCEGTTATFENNDENASGLQLANESKIEKGSVEGAQQADENKLTTTSSDHTEQVVKEGDCTEEVDPTLNRSPKSVMSNGVNVVAKEEASVDQESSKKPEEDVNEKHLDKEDTDDSDTDKLAKAESQTEQTSKKRGKKTDTVINSAEPSDSSHVEGDKEIEKDNDVKESDNEEDNEVKESENEEDNEVKESDNEEDNDAKESENEEDNDVKESENEEDNDVKESENEAVIPSEIEKDNDVAQVSSSKAKENKPATANVSSPSQSNSLPDESCVKKSISSKKKQVPQKDEIASPSKSQTPPDETRVKKAGQPKSKGSTQDDASEEMGDLDIKPKKRAGKKAVVAKEVKPPSKDEPEDDREATSDSDAKPVRKSRSKLTKQSGKKVAVGDSEAKKPKQSDVKKSKQSGKKVEKEEESDSDAKPLKLTVKKGEKSKITVEEEEESDSENKPPKLSAKKSNSKKKDDVKKRGNGKNVTQKDQAKSLSGDDEMEIDSSPKSATKSAKGEGNSKETPVTSAKRKRTTGKDKVFDTIKYDESLIGSKVKVWWPEDKMYYEGVVEAFYSAKKKHKVLYVDGEVETLNLKTQKWEILEEFSVRNEEPTIEAQSEEASPQIHKKKRTKTETASQEKIKDSAKRVAGVSSSSRSRVSASKDNKSKDNSKETGKSKEDEETPMSKTTSKSKGKTPQTSGKSNTNGPTKGKSGSSNVKEPEAVKTSEITKGGSKSGKKRKRS